MQCTSLVSNFFIFPDWKKQIGRSRLEEDRFKTMMSSEDARAYYKYKETVATTGGIYSLYKKGTFLWPTGAKSCVVLIRGKSRKIQLKSISKLKEKKKATIDPTEEEKLLEMQHLLEKADLIKKKINKAQAELKSKK
jgi:hypothetical protein